MSGYTIGAGSVVVVDSSVVVVDSSVVVVSATVVVVVAAGDDSVAGDASSSPPPLQAATRITVRASATEERNRNRGERIATILTSGPREVTALFSNCDCAGSLFPVSPLATEAPSQIITITPEALSALVGLRDTEPDADRLGLRLEIVSKPGEDFQYDLSFDVITKAAFTDEVRTHTGDDQTLKVIIPANSIELLNGATLDHTESAGLVIRNPNKPAAPVVEGLVNDDALSAQIESVVSGEVNPALAAHGGFVTYVGHDEGGTVYLTMGGGCHGCSMSRMTMLDGVQTMIMEQVEGVERVRDLTDHTTGENPYYH